MSLPTETQIRTLITAACTALDQARTNGISFLTDHEAFVGLGGAYATGSLSRSFTAAEANRSRVASTVAAAAAQAILRPLWETYFEVKGFQQQAFQRSMELLREDFNANSESVNSRGVVFGSVTDSRVGGNAGDGYLYRCTVDRFGEPLESVFAETKTFRCISDQHGSGGGSRHQEIFQVTGAPEAQDEIQRTGSGLNASMTAVSARNSLLGNASFDSYSGSGSSLAVSNWTINTPANVTPDGTNYFRTAGGNTSPTPYAMQLGGNVQISQKLSVKNIQLDPLRPTWLSLRYNRSIGSGTGQLDLKLGTQTVSVAVLGSAPAGWNLLRIPLDANCYLENFNEDQIDVFIELSSYSSGYTLIDDCLLQQLDGIDGTFWLIVGGASPFEFNDEFTAADTASTDSSLVQKWLDRAFGEYLPSKKDGSETWSGS